MIDVVEIDDTLIPIVGRRSTLRNAISGRPASFANARWPVIYFSTALQAKSGGSNPVSAMSLFHRAISSPAPMVVIMES